MGQFWSVCVGIVWPGVCDPRLQTFRPLRGAIAVLLFPTLFGVCISYGFYEVAISPVKRYGNAGIVIGKHKE